MFSKEFIAKYKEKSKPKVTKWEAVGLATQMIHKGYSSQNLLYSAYISLAS